MSNTQDVQLGHFQTPITDHPMNAGPNKKGGASCKDKDDMITVRTTYDVHQFEKEEQNIQNMF